MMYARLSARRGPQIKTATSTTKTLEQSLTWESSERKNCNEKLYRERLWEDFYWQTCRRRTLLLSGHSTATLQTIVWQYGTVRDNQILAAAAAGAASGWQWHGFMVALINGTAILKLNLGVATVSQWASEHRWTWAQTEAQLLRAHGLRRNRNVFLYECIRSTLTLRWNFLCKK